MSKNRDRKNVPQIHTECYCSYHEKYRYNLLKLDFLSNKNFLIFGLQNIGNTCFMNTGIQILLHIPELVNFFLLKTTDFLEAFDSFNAESETKLAPIVEYIISHSLTKIKTFTNQENHKHPFCEKISFKEFSVINGTMKNCDLRVDFLKSRYEKIGINDQQKAKNSSCFDESVYRIFSLQDFKITNEIQKFFKGLIDAKLFIHEIWEAFLGKFSGLLVKKSDFRHIKYKNHIDFSNLHLLFKIYSILDRFFCKRKKYSKDDNLVELLRCFRNPKIIYGHIFPHSLDLEKKIDYIPKRLDYPWPSLNKEISKKIRNPFFLKKINNKHTGNVLLKNNCLKDLLKSKNKESALFRSYSYSFGASQNSKNDVYNIFTGGKHNDKKRRFCKFFLTKHAINNYFYEFFTNPDNQLGCSYGMSRIFHELVRNITKNKHLYKIKISLEKKNSKKIRITNLNVVQSVLVSKPTQMNLSICPTLDFLSRLIFCEKPPALYSVGDHILHNKMDDNPGFMIYEDGYDGVLPSSKKIVSYTNSSKQKMYSYQENTSINFDNECDSDPEFGALYHQSRVFDFLDFARAVNRTRNKYYSISTLPLKCKMDYFFDFLKLRIMESPSNHLNSNLGKFKPIEFHRNLDKQRPGFCDFRQHDAGEFFSMILDSLHEDLSWPFDSKNEQYKMMNHDFRYSNSVKVFDFIKYLDSCNKSDTYFLYKNKKVTQNIHLNHQRRFFISIPSQNRFSYIKKNSFKSDTYSEILPRDDMISCVKNHSNLEKNILTKVLSKDFRKKNNDSSKTNHYYLDDSCVDCLLLYNRNFHQRIHSTLYEIRIDLFAPEKALYMFNLYVDLYVRIPKNDFSNILYFISDYLNSKYYKIFSISPFQYCPTFFKDYAKLLHKFYQHLTINYKNSKKECLISVISHLTKNIDSKKIYISKIRNSSVKQTHATNITFFKKYIMSYCANNIEFKQFWLQNLSEKYSLIKNLFSGLLKSKRVCLKCNKETISYESFMSLNLPIRSPIKCKIFVLMRKRIYNMKNISQNMTIEDFRCIIFDFIKTIYKNIFLNEKLIALSKLGLPVCLKRSSDLQISENSITSVLYDQICDENTRKMKNTTRNIEASLQNEHLSSFKCGENISSDESDGQFVQNSHTSNFYWDINDNFSDLENFSSRTHKLRYVILDYSQKNLKKIINTENLRKSKLVLVYVFWDGYENFKRFGTLAKSETSKNLEKSHVFEKFPILLKGFDIYDI